MKRGTITIDGKGNVHIPSTPVWMSACEIADLLGAFSGKVNAQIKAIFKEGLLMETEAMQTLHFEHGFTDLYGMEMITILSFRIAIPKAKNLRRWIIGRLSEKKTNPILFVYYSKDVWYN